MSNIIVGTPKPWKGIKVANFVTATRPAAPSTGLIIYNTETEQVECWDGTQWFEVGVIPPPPPPPDLPTAYKTLVDAAAAAGTLLYVDSATGSDANSGGTYDSALGSLSKAVELASNGYTIYVMPGRHINMDNTYLKTGRSYGHGHLDDYGKQITFIGYPGRTIIGDEDPFGCTNGADSYCGNSAYGPYCGGMINANSKAIGFIVERNRPGQSNAVAGQAMFSQDAGGYTSPSGLRGEYLNCVFRNITNVDGDGTYNNGTTYAFQFNNGIFECPFTGNNYRTGNSGSTMSGVGYTRDSFPTSGMGSISQASVTLDAQWKSSNTSYGVYVGTYAWDETMVLPYPGATSPTVYSSSTGGGGDGGNTGGNSSSENYYDGGGLYPSTTTYSTYGTVVENVTATLPYSTSDWDHYNGKVRDLQGGGFKITFSDNNNPSSDFFMGCWVKFDTYQQSRQMGINLSGNYVYWETRENGKVGIRHNGGSRQDSASGTGIDDGDWHYISLSRNSNTLAGCVDGTLVVSTTSGVSGNSVPANADFWFFGGSGTSYNIDGKILDPIIALNNGNAGSTFVPTKPLIDSSLNFNNGTSGTGPFFLSPGWNYASPGISLGGSSGGSSLSLYNTWGLNNSASSTGNAGTALNDITGVTYTTSSKLGSHALSFDGSNDYVRFECPNANTTWSVGFWIYWRGHNSAGRSYLVDFRPSGQGNGYWLIDSTNEMKYLQADGTERAISFTPTNNTWEHYVLVSDDGAVAKIYRNGVLIDTGTQNGDTVGGNANLGTYFGARGNSGQYFMNAIIDQFFFDDSALTASQVTQIYNRTQSF